MIKPNELRLGNWVQYAQGAVKCMIGAFSYEMVGIFENISDLENKLREERALHIKQIFPIHLTPKILEGCGFKWENEKKQHLGLYISEDCTMSFFYEDGQINQLQFYSQDGMDFFMLDKTFPKYLHQLQNLFFALTGEELTVNLNVEATK